MRRLVSAAVSPLVDRVVYGRWVFLLGGAALMVPYILVYMGIPALLSGRAPLFTGIILAVVWIALSSSVAFVPAVRTLERTAVEAMLHVTLPEETPEGVRSWRARRRTAAWFALHLGLGSLAGLPIVIAIPVTVQLLQTPFLPDGVEFTVGDGLIHLTGVWPVLLGPTLIVVLFYFGAAVGALSARLAPVLLGPSPADRMAWLERHSERLLERNRLAGELHDSVGHALTVTTLQAGAAKRLLDTDPEFACRALSAIEEAGRTALDDLDHVLGLLREETASTAPQRTLDDLDDLFERARSAGGEVSADVDVGTDRVPPVVSREAYRIVQEGLTNVLRHAGRVPVTVRVVVGAEELELEMTNPIGEAARTRSGGGRGLRGVRERVGLLGGRMSAGADDGRWHVAVRLPSRWTP